MGCFTNYGKVLLVTPHSSKLYFPALLGMVCYNAIAHPQLGISVLPKPYIERIKERLNLVQCQNDAGKYIQNCDICAQKGGPPKSTSKYLTGSLEKRLAVDVLGPLPTTESSNKYVVKIVDYFT